ncbi:PepSY domain-containing protein [Tunturiibacter psychrotolerans]|uniref:PepSY domain-containing protein n=1 Tax=Tunturiibacter psychrotolerans TaxID=3069686 RepID=UPI003D20ED50
MQEASATDEVCQAFRPANFGGRAITLRRLLFWVHLGVGIIIGLVIGFLAVTGSILTFQPQIIAFAERSIQLTSPTQGSCVAPSDLLKNASDYWHGSATALALFSDPHRPTEVSFGSDSVVLVNSCDGRVIGNGCRKTAWFFFGRKGSASLGRSQWCEA